MLHVICVVGCIGYLDVISRGSDGAGRAGDAEGRASAVAPPERADIPNMYLSLKVIPYSEKSSLVQIYIYLAKKPTE